MSAKFEESPEGPASPDMEEPSDEEDVDEDETQEVRTTFLTGLKKFIVSLGLSDLKATECIKACSGKPKTKLEHGSIKPTVLVSWLASKFA